MLARLLTLLTQNAPGNDLLEERFNKLAERIAINRTVAGVHFPVDSAAGQLLGTSLADYLVCVASCGSGALRGANSKEWIARTFVRNQPEDEARDFTRGGLVSDETPTTAKAVTYSPVKMQSKPPLQWLWEAAASEWP